jgi:hypothetical protein
MQQSVREMLQRQQTPEYIVRQRRRRSLREYETAITQREERDREVFALMNLAGIRYLG